MHKAYRIGRNLSAGTCEVLPELSKQPLCTNRSLHDRYTEDTQDSPRSFRVNPDSRIKRTLKDSKLTYGEAQYCNERRRYVRRRAIVEAIKSAPPGLSLRKLQQWVKERTGKVPHANTLKAALGSTLEQVKAIERVLFDKALKAFVIAAKDLGKKIESTANAGFHLYIGPIAARNPKTEAAINRALARAASAKNAQARQPAQEKISPAPLDNGRSVRMSAAAMAVLFEHRRKERAARADKLAFIEHARERKSAGRDGRGSAWDRARESFGKQFQFFRRREEERRREEQRARQEFQPANWGAYASFKVNVLVPIDHAALDYDDMIRKARGKRWQ